MNLLIWLSFQLGNSLRPNLAKALFSYLAHVNYLKFVFWVGQFGFANAGAINCESYHSFVILKQKSVHGRLVAQVSRRQRLKIKSW